MQASCPDILEEILKDSVAMGFSMLSETKTGRLLKVIAASRPGGEFLELGTGTGASTCWLLAGMDDDSVLDTVDNDEKVIKTAEKHLGHDPRIRFHLQDGLEFLDSVSPGSVDVLFADAWPGKFIGLDAALSKLKKGGIYLIDDMLPQDNWPDGHEKDVAKLVDALEAKPNLHTVKMDWASGIVLASVV